MNRFWLLVAGLVLTCNSSYADTKQTEVTTSEKKNTVAPDNTGKNVRDRKEANPTPEDQSGKKSAVDTTRSIRKAIMAYKGLSVNAQNVKIIAKNGVVTLRGPVDSAEEKAIVDSLAKEHAGASCQVVNETEVKAAKADKKSH